MPNVFEPEFDDPADLPEPFRARGASIGREAGARELGASLYELPQGQAVCPMHAHHGNEEMLIVLQGRPTLRTLDRERELATGEVVAFPAGRDGAHRVDNHRPEPARVLIVSTMHAVDVLEYPDSGKVMARTYAPTGDATVPDGELRIMTRSGESLGYFDGEV